MTTYPVHYRVEPPAQFTPVQLLARFAAFVALGMLGLWSAVLTMSGKYDDLLTYTTFASLLFNAATAACVLVLRKSLPDERRPYRALGYPVSTLAFIFVALGFVIYIVQGDPRSSLYGLGLVLLGVPAYFLMNRESSSPKP